MAEILFKPTMQCNANCSYCHAFDRYKSKIASESLLERLFLRINEFLQESPNERVNLIWHGGEPTLLPPSYYLKALKIQDSLCHDSKNRISHSIQSNLTNLKPEHLNVFYQLGIRHISSSYDPIQGVRGKRVANGIDWESYDKAFLRNLRLLESKGFSRSVIYTTHRRSLRYPLEIYKFLLNISNGMLMFNPVDIYGDDPYDLGITPQEYADFLGAVLSAWWPERNLYPEVKPFQGYLNAIVKGGRMTVCNNVGRCTRTHLYIGPDGSSSLCCASADFDIITFGNLQDRSISEMMRDPLRHTIRARNDHLPHSECLDCRFWEACYGGCPARAYIKFKDFSRKCDWCAFKRMFVEKYFEPLAGVRFNGTWKSGGLAAVN